MSKKGNGPAYYRRGWGDNIFPNHEELTKKAALWAKDMEKKLAEERHPKSSQERLAPPPKNSLPCLQAHPTGGASDSALMEIRSEESVERGPHPLDRI